MYNALLNIYNSQYFELYFLLFSVLFLYAVYCAYKGAFTVSDTQYSTNMIRACFAAALVLVSACLHGYAIEASKTTVRYEFVTEDGEKHEGQRCYLSGDLFSSDGMYCVDTDGVTYTNVDSYKKIVEAPDEN